MAVKLSDRVGTFAETDTYATGDANRTALGFHSVYSTAERNLIPIDRRKYTYENGGVNATPRPFFVCVRTGTEVKLWWLKNEPGTDTTTDNDWQEFVASTAEPFQGFFDPAAATPVIANGTGVIGQYWIASVAGARDLGAGSIDFLQYDQAKYDGALWQKVGGSSASVAWVDIAGKPATFPPDVHTHVMSDITDLATTLANYLPLSDVKSQVNNSDAEVPTSGAVVRYTYSKDETDNMFRLLSTYGIKYAWNSQAEQDAQTGQHAGDLGLRRDTNDVYKWDGISWGAPFFSIVGTGVGHVIANDTISFAQRNKLQFLGNVTITDDIPNSATVVTINNDGTVTSVNGATGVVVLDTDDISEPTNPNNKWFSMDRVLATLLTGLTVATTATITTADTVIMAFGKLQGQINTLLGRIQNNLNTDGTGNKIPTVDAVNAGDTKTLSDSKIYIDGILTGGVGYLAKEITVQEYEAVGTNKTFLVSHVVNTIIEVSMNGQALSSAQYTFTAPSTFNISSAADKDLITIIYTYGSTTVDVANKEDKANKQNSLAIDGTGTKYPTVDAVNAGNALKATDNAVVHLAGAETITGYKTVTNNHFFVGTDGYGFQLFDGGLFYKKSGSGLVIRLNTGNLRLQCESNGGVTQGTYAYTSDFDLQNNVATANLTVGGGFTTVVNQTNITRTNGICQLSIIITNAVIYFAGGIIATLPTGTRPLTAKYFPVIGDNGSTNILKIEAATGKISLVKDYDQTTIRATMTYFPN